MKKSIIGAIALLLGICITSCSDANEYKDADTSNPSWAGETVTHPETLASTSWVRGSGMKFNAYGAEIQGFVESLNFVSADSVKVKMSEGVTAGTWVDESNTEKTPLYEYTYSSTTGKIQIMKRTVDDKGKVSKTDIFTGIAVSGSREVITIAHFGDTPVQTYLVKQ